MKNKAFTLIELLVVVLIIGILAAIAVPQYKFAVDKTKLANLLAMTKSVVESEEAYYLAHGEYTNKWNNLDISLPGNINNPVLSSTEGWSLYLTLDGGGSANAVLAYSTNLPDITLYAFYNNNHTKFWRGIGCYAKKTNDWANKLCKNLTNKTYAENSAGSGANSQHVYYIH